MGLAIGVGILADLIKNDPEGAEWMRENLSCVNKLLAANNLPTHSEPETLIPEPSRDNMGGFPYSFLHYLRRIYAHLAQNPQWKPTEVSKGADPSEYPVVDDELSMMRSHLLCHSDAEGFYIPIDFEEVIYDDGDSLPGGMLGSTQKLMKELVSIAPVLGITFQNGELSDAEAQRLNQNTAAEGPFWIEKCVWLSLYEAARLSLKYHSAICFM